MKFQDDPAHNRISFTFDHYRIGLPTSDGIAMILCKDILRCEAHKAHTVFYLTSGETMTVKRNLGFYEDKLREWNFCKVHKSHLVNLQHVEEYVEGEEHHHVMLSDKSIVPVSIRRREEIAKRIAFSRSFMAFGERLGAVRWNA